MEVLLQPGLRPALQLRCAEIIQLYGTCSAVPEFTEIQWK